VLDPFIVAINGVPRIALAPLMIIWFGIGDLSKMVLAGLLTFFLCFYSTMSGLRAVDQQHINIARVMRASPSQVFFKVALPSAFPWIITALKVSLPFALIGAIVGEFIASTAGIGYMIRMFTSQYDTTGAMSAIILLMVCIILMNTGLDRVEAHVLRWRPKGNIGTDTSRE
jgi:NitT/TauT family transport system permease protein